jgi:hypothetical protein
VDGHVIEERAAYTVDRVLESIDALPAPERLEAAFDEETAYAAFAAEHAARQAQCGDILWCEADWELIPKALWYHEYGYEGAMMTLALHPDEYRKLIRFSATRGRHRAILRARAIQEGYHPRAILSGEDLCNQRGLMVSPEFLRREYYPLLEYALEPLLAVGAKVVWHCDGNSRPVLDDILACGIGGLQGFQRECGMALKWIVDLRTRTGDPLVIFGPMSVTTTLPHGTPDEIRAEVDRAMRECRGKASLVFLTSNTIIPDTPLQSIQAFWDSALASRW